MKAICYYHSADLDGMFSAAVVRKKYPNIELCGFDYGDKVIHAINYDKVIMVDLSLPLEQMMFLKKNNKEFIWIDHHARTISEAEAVGFETKGFKDKKNEYSACVLAWRYFFNDKIPYILSIVQDQDLWKFVHSETEDITMGIEYLHERDIDLYTKMIDDFSAYHDDILKAGHLFGLMRDIEINRTLKNALISKWDGENVAIVNAKHHASKVGNKLLDEYSTVKFSAVWNIKGKQARISLRCRKDFDVSKIAKKYNGGGHNQASGFHMPMEMWFKFLNNLS